MVFLFQLSVVPTTSLGPPRCMAIFSLRISGSPFELNTPHPQLITKAWRPLIDGITAITRPWATSYWGYNHIANKYSNMETAREIWDNLEAQYSKPSIVFVYTEFKALIHTNIPDGNHPAPAFAKLTVHFQHLKEFKFEVSKEIQVLLVLAKLCHIYIWTLICSCVVCNSGLLDFT